MFCRWYVYFTVVYSIWGMKHFSVITLGLLSIHPLGNGAMTTHAMCFTILWYTTLTMLYVNVCMRVLFRLVVSMKYSHNEDLFQRNSTFVSRETWDHSSYKLLLGWRNIDIKLAFILFFCFICSFSTHLICKMNQYKMSIKWGYISRIFSKQFPSNYS